MSAGLPPAVTWRSRSTLPPVTSCSCTPVWQVKACSSGPKAALRLPAWATISCWPVAGTQPDLALRLPGVGHEQLLAVLVPAEVPNHLLGGGSHHEVGEGLAAGGVD